MLRLAAVLLLCLSVPAQADSLSPGTDRELAERNFRLGSERYEETDYAGALDAFRRARASFPSAALDYNVARCLDRLDRPEEAIADYERYLAKQPHGASADDVRARVAILRERVRALEAERRGPRRADKPVYKRWWLWTSLTLAAAAGVAVGLGVGLTRGGGSAPSASTDYGTIRFP